MITPLELQTQLRNFNETGYSDPSTEYKSNGKDGQILRIISGIWTYEDEFYGGEPYSGNETIWHNNQVCFRCVYWGKVSPGVQFTDIYIFLRTALQQKLTGKSVHRGPECFTKNDLVYTNTTEGDIRSFQSIERIFKAGVEVYTAWFIGGFVNEQKE